MRRLLLVTGALAAGGVTAAFAANPTPPAATTGGASGIATNAATVSATVAANGADTAWQIQYGTSTGYGLTTPAQTIAATVTAPQTVTVPLTGLTKATTYHYRVAAANAAGITNGSDRSFKTAAPPQAPGVATGGVKGVARDGVTLTGSVNPHGLQTSYAFDIGTTKSYGRRTPTTDTGAGTTSVSVRQLVLGLSPGTTYHYRLLAISSAGTTYGNDHSFTTVTQPLTIAIAAQPRPLTFGHGLTITGALRGDGAANQAVTLQSQPFPFTAKWATVGSTHLSGSDGSVRFDLPTIDRATRYRLTRGGTVSGVVLVRVRPTVTLRVRRLSRRSIRVSGTVAPVAPGETVSIQRLRNDGRFVPLARVGLQGSTTSSRFAATIAFSRRATLRAVFAVRGGPLARGYSTRHRVRGR